VVDASDGGPSSPHAARTKVAMATRRASDISGNGTTGAVSAECVWHHGALRLEHSPLSCGVNSTSRVAIDQKPRDFGGHGS
jgi:hypothetical protein